MYCYCNGGHKFHTFQKRLEMFDRCCWGCYRCFFLNSGERKNRTQCKQSWQNLKWKLNINVCNSCRKNSSEVKSQCTYDHRWKWNEIAKSSYSVLNSNDVCNKSMFHNFCRLTIKSCKEQNINEIMVNKSSKTNIPNWG